MKENPFSGTNERRVLKVFVAYDHPEAVLRAELLCGEMEAADEFPFKLQPWRFNEAATMDETPLRLAAATDIFVISWSAPEGPPEKIFPWVLDWAVHRTVANATLAALPVGAALGDRATPQVLHRLRQLAATTGIVFVCDWTEGLTPHRPGFSSALHDREQSLTPTMMAILGEHRYVPRIDWGLNE